MKYNDKANVYGADNRWHECTYIGNSPNKGHHIVYRNGKPWECADEMIETANVGISPYDRLTDVQKAFYDGYDKGWNEREKRFKTESENAIKKVLSERYLGSKVVNAKLFAGHILREIGMITNDLEREMESS